MERRRDLIKICLAIVFLFNIAYFVGASTERIIMDAKTSYTLNGKNITLVGVYGDRANFNVDGVFSTVRRDDFGFVNGVKVNVTGISVTPPKVIVIFTVDYICGDNSCSSLESQIICCKDCGCFSVSETCMNNMCAQNISRPEATYECYVTSDCDDDNPCTIETCNAANIPYRCEYTEIEACINNDKCCPLNCEDAQDNDCLTADRCKRHDDCDDSNPCTTETCEGQPKRCNFIKQEGCILDDKCVTIGYIEASIYCDKSGSLLNKKSDNEKCSEAYECFSGVWTLKRCGKNSFIYRLFKTSTLFAGILAIFLLICYVVITRRKKNIM